jgi:excisionase family DNA binding protein
MDRTVTSEDFLTVSEVATRLRVKNSWVYQHADDLGAYRLGKYLRFSWDRVLERLDRRDGN